MTPIKATVHYSTNAIMEITAEGFPQLASAVLGLDELFHPLYIILDEKKYLYNRNVFYSIARGNMDMQEFIARFQIDGVCRNKETIEVYGQEVDMQSLWFKKGDRLYLIDDDNFLETEYDSNTFTELS